ncbi:MAG TPA: histidinol dehydrogenase [Gemmatimonadaceae bacterium]|nr:histidinol dehydrogenase [Gemmatimonadaceae bacterium]
MSATMTVPMRYTGRVRDLSPAVYRWLCERSTSSDPDVRESVTRVIADVRNRGDAALRELAQRYDGVSLDALEVPRSRMVRALDALDVDMRRALERAARNITHAHASMRPMAFACETEPGVVVGRRPDPLARVGVYAPGGDAAYPSSVLMGAIPARAAGVGEVVLCSPPRGSEPSPLVLAAAAIAEVDRVFAVGGAGAIAALAYGTESIRRVDRIVGPGNAYVAEAKLQVTGAVAIDSPAGPSELLVLADESCDPRRVALEMLAQAEHDPRACVVAVVIGDGTALSLTTAIGAALGAQPRRDVIARALATNGGVLVAVSMDEAIAFAADYAPEHLLLVLEDAESVLERVRNAGTVFVGASASVSFGDYMTGANHVLPTGGLARSYSGLSPLDFVRWTTYQRVTPRAAAALAADVATFATGEGLPGHAIAARSAGGLT